MNPLRCPLCGGQDHSPWPRMALRQCRVCSLVFDRRVGQEGSDVETEREWFEEGYIGSSSLWVKAFERLNNGRTYNRIAPFLANGAHLLEIGVGSGSFLEYSKGRGVDVAGCDLSRAICEDISRRLRIPVFNCPVSNLPTDTKYDVVVMNHVLEHVTSPVSLLESVRSRMKGTGLLHLAVPNVACWEAALPGWVGYEPYHFVYFSPETARKAAEESGFQVIRMLTHESFSGWFLSSLRTVMGTRLSDAKHRYEMRRRRTTTWLEHGYRTAMVLAGITTLPVRALQGRMKCGDEVVLVCELAGRL